MEEQGNRETGYQKSSSKNDISMSQNLFLKYYCFFIFIFHTNICVVNNAQNVHSFQQPKVCHGTLNKLWLHHLFMRENKTHKHRRHRVRADHIS